MNKEFIPYSEALELKELGFDERCLAYYPNEMQLFFPNDDEDYMSQKRTGEWEPLHAPLYQQAFRFFREKYEILHLIKYETGLYEYQFTYRANHYYGVYETYEEAELACLKKLIEIVKNK